ncbi:TOMM precursor leader peptide-binding protein [Actinacidiphila paucisporea]|uniref:Ribosomal protein S12 methylthiotransferase accessory factor n=1 Tax=Actinacidiphila paucisporea TaxID=310782 RepID=A0A1M7FSC0_9ACTN|nr:TOMM precursor leader peptide-binding protein [Actinacidiphila paucisporea]SHM06825.1 ribosomal protein S12 methylthiotransferase accessory factor [Actinacidiphila paucisporea]
MTGAVREAEQGGGLLAAAMADAGLPWPVLALDAALASTGQPAVVALDRWTPDQAVALSAHAWRGGSTLLPVRVDGSTALVGPLLHRGAPACLGCAEAERLATAGGRTPRDQGDLVLGGVPAPTAVPLLAALAADALADTARWSGTMWAVRTDDGTCSTHRARPRRGGCPICGPLPEDTPELARFVPAARPLPDPRRLRQDNPATTRAGLRAALYDWRLGPVASVSRRETYPLAFAGAAVVGDREERDAGYGRALTFAEAERVALFEAVERMAGTAPRGKRTALRGSFAEIGPRRAVDPARFGLYEPHAADLPEARIARYTPDTVTDWVYGWSTGEDRAVAVPEQMAYWGLPRRGAGAGVSPFVRETSSGCGLGNSLEEAVLHGLFEVAERDAFLMAWYARTPLAPVAPPDDDPLVGHCADLLDALGYDLRLFDSTNDFGVPAVVSLVLCQDAASAAPQAFFAAGAHPDPREAIRSAVVEAVVSVGAVTQTALTSPEKLDRDRLLRMLDEPRRVVSMEDHTALYTLPEARSRFDFLLAGTGPPRPWQRVWPGSPRPVRDLGALLAETAARVVRAGMDVVFVDQSDPVVRDTLGLHAAKVLVPGALPMTFGHVHRRTRGLPRLLDVPWRLGRLPARPRYRDLPLDPHPFP